MKKFLVTCISVVFGYLCATAYITYVTPKFSWIDIAIIILVMGLSRVILNKWFSTNAVKLDVKQEVGK